MSPLLTNTWYFNPGQITYTQKSGEFESYFRINLNKYDIPSKLFSLYINYNQFMAASGSVTAGSLIETAVSPRTPLTFELIGRTRSCILRISVGLYLGIDSKKNLIISSTAFLWNFREQSPLVGFTATLSSGQDSVRVQGTNFVLGAGTAFAFTVIDS